MTDEPKRRSYAVDDIETISRRMKEIAEECEAARAEPNPLDGERLMAEMRAAMNWDYVTNREKNPKPDSLEFWQPLIDAGILEVGEA